MTIPFDIGCSGDSERVNLLSACLVDLSRITTEAELKEAMIQKGAEKATLILHGDPGITEKAVAEKTVEDLYLSTKKAG